MAITSRALLQSLIILILATVCGCAQHNRAPVVDLERPALTGRSIHVVNKGETLYSIAWRYGLDFRELAAINGIRSPYLITVGQTLRLKGTAAASSSRPTASSSRQTTSGSQPSQTTSQSTSRSAAAVSGWRWPVSSRSLSARFDGQTNKGIDIQIKQTSNVIAAATGVVVYAGDGLKSYGNLVIIKHNEIYLSAYAHNSSLAVKEGQQVKSGEKIAVVDSGTKLHFEIRKQGQPVNPLTYLK